MRCLKVAVMLTALWLGCTQGCATPPSPVQAQAEAAMRGWAEDAQIIQALKPYRACLMRMSDGQWRALGDDCEASHPPQSTFKIPNALIGLETGVITGPDHVMKYDGHPVAFEVWAKDHDLGSAIASSVIWYFQAVASAVGRERMTQWVASFGYGDQDVSGALTSFWLNSSLKISARQQVEFLAKLERGALPCATAHQDTVKSLIKLGPVGTHQRMLFGKTGSRFKEDGIEPLGWFVGWIAQEDGHVSFFALHLRGADAGGRLARSMVERWAR